MKEIFATGINGLLGTNLTNDLINIGLNINLQDFKVLIPVVGSLIGFIIFWFTQKSEKLKQQFIDNFGTKAGMVKFIVYTRYLGAFSMGVLPASIYLLVFPKTTLSQLGLGFYNETFLSSILWTILLCAILIPLVSFNARKPKSFINYPQIRINEWNPNIIRKNLFSWVVYLLGYEMMFRGLLLFPLVDEIGLWPAIAVNVTFYSSTHIPKGRDEAIGAIPLSIIFCLLCTKTGTIWVAFFVHIAIAWTNTIFALKNHPDMYFISKSK